MSRRRPEARYPGPCRLGDRLCRAAALAAGDGCPVARPLRPAIRNLHTSDFEPRPSIFSLPSWRSRAHGGLLPVSRQHAIPVSRPPSLPPSIVRLVTSAGRRLAWGMGRETWGKGRETWGMGRETWGKGRETWGKGREAWGKGREAWGKTGEAWGKTHEAWGKAHEAWGNAFEAWGNTNRLSGRCWNGSSATIQAWFVSSEATGRRS